MNPVLGLGEPRRRGPAGCSGVACGAALPLIAAQIGGYDVVIADTQAPAVFGANGEFFASGRLDNLSATHAGLAALIAHAAARFRCRSARRLPSWPRSTTRKSVRRRGPGPAGPILEDVLVRISDGLGASVSQRRQALAASFCVSADAGHAVHPNYPERHDPANRPVLNGGPLLKINANQRYATDAAGAASGRGCAARPGSLPGIRVQQRDAVRLHHRAADRHPPGNPDRGRGRAPAVHALGAGAVRRGGPAPAGWGDGAVLQDCGLATPPGRHKLVRIPT